MEANKILVLLQIADLARGWPALQAIHNEAMNELAKANVELAKAQAEELAKAAKERAEAEAKARDEARAKAKAEAEAEAQGHPPPLAPGQRPDGLPPPTPVQRNL